MDNGLIYNLLNTIIRKEKEGQTISPEQYTELLQMGSWEKANADYNQYENTQVLTDSLRLLERRDSVTIGAGSADLPSDYWHLMNAYHNNSTNGGKEVTPFDIVTDEEFIEYQHSDLVQPTTFYPILTVYDDKVEIVPTSITGVALRYLKKPDEPFFDYYIDADDNIQYLEPGQVYTLQADEEYRDGTTVGDVTSISVELDFPEGERVQVLYIILEKLGVSLNEADALEYGIAREQKEEVQ